MSITIKDISLHVLNMYTRMPFRYGIATLEAVPHLFARLVLETDGVQQWGIASEGLAPKWFTKNPDSTFRQDIEDMICVIRSACTLALEVGVAATPFDLWQQVYMRQEDWAKNLGPTFPPLLSSFGVSIVERAVIDAFCRAKRLTFGQAVRSGVLGLRLGDLHPQLTGQTPAALLPPKPARRLIVRHTVGLSDPITDQDVPPADRVGDGLPQTLEACIRHYGLTHLKIKLSGHAVEDVWRLKQLVSAVGRKGGELAFTLDGNEFFREVEPFKQLWQRLHEEKDLRLFMRGLLFVEQPFHRDVALSDDVCRGLRKWPDRPPIIIDESDGELDSVSRALDGGYAGGSYKNCKGVFKGVINACLIADRHRRNPQRQYVISGEDMCSVGPVAMLQDLAAAANIGIEHIERNGHHYFAGLNMYSQDVQQQVLEKHGDLYRRHTTPSGTSFAALRVEDGAIAVGSVVDAPFAPDFELDPRRFTPLDQWRYESLDDDV